MFSRYGIVNTDTYGKYGIDEYYSFYDECHGHRHCFRITRWSFRCLVW
jgi:hypothetical protein